MHCDFVLCPLQFLLLWRLTDFNEQYLYITVCFRVGKTAMGTFEVLKLVLVGETVSTMEESDWLSKFRSGVTCIRDDFDVLFPCLLSIMVKSTTYGV